MRKRIDLHLLRNNFWGRIHLKLVCPDLLKYEGAAKDVFNIAMDLQIILSTVFKEDTEEDWY